MKIETYTPDTVMKPIGPYSHVDVYLRNIEDFEEMNRAYREAFGDHLPARTVIGVSALPKEGALLTIDLSAVTSDDAAGR